MSISMNLQFNNYIEQIDSSPLLKITDINSR